MDIKNVNQECPCSLEGLLKNVYDRFKAEEKAAIEKEAGILEEMANKLDGTELDTKPKKGEVEANVYRVEKDGRVSTITLGSKRLNRKEDIRCIKLKFSTPEESDGRNYVRSRSTFYFLYKDSGIITKELYDEMRYAR